MRKRDVWRLLPCLTLLPGCGVSGLDLVQDTRVDIVEPREGAEVRLPLTVRWTADDRAFGAHRPLFGVVVDDAPPRPGNRADDDVLRTDRPEARLEQLGVAARGAGRGGHEITVVLLDEDGRRRGEGAWRVRVDVVGER